MGYGNIRLTIAALAGAAVLLAACSASSPRQIAVYPAAPAATAIARAPYDPNRIIIYNAYLEYEVPDVDTASARAIQIAADYGGYLDDSQSWYQDSQKVATVVLAVPALRFDEVRRALSELGQLASERISSESIPPDTGTDGWARFSHITLTLRQGPSPVLALPPAGWNPVRTFERAFAVIAAIFQFVADILIWVIVVGGPFALVAGLLWLLVRRARKA